MNVNQKIKQDLDSLNIDVYADVCNDKKDEYIVFNYSDERPIVRADDEDLYDSTTIQVHYFTKSNPMAKKKTIQTCLRSGGFLILSVQQFYESDTNFYHVVVECSIEGII